MYDQLSS